MNLQSAHSHLNLQFDSQQEADDYVAEFVVKFERYLKDDRNIEKLVKYIEKVIFARLRQEYMELIIALGDYFLRGLDDYEYDPILPYYPQAIWSRQELIDRREIFLECQFTRFYRSAPVDFDMVYEAYMLREERFGCIVFSSDASMLTIRPKGIGKLAFPKGCRKVYKYTDGEVPETERDAAIRITTEKTSLCEELLLEHITQNSITVQPYLWTIKFFLVPLPIPANHPSLGIGTIRNTTDVDSASWNDTILDYERGNYPVKDKYPCMPYVRAMDRALDVIIASASSCPTNKLNGADTFRYLCDRFPTDVLLIPNKRKKKGGPVTMLMNIIFLPWILVILAIVINRALYEQGIKPESNPYWREPENSKEHCPY